LFLLFFSKYLGTWRQPSFGIALSFGVYATLELSAVSLRLRADISEDTLNLITTGAYVGAICIWATYSLLKFAARDNAVTLLRSQP
jgi:hypothetical protein